MVAAQGSPILKSNCSVQVFFDSGAGGGYHGYLDTRELKIADFILYIAPF